MPATGENQDFLSAIARAAHEANRAYCDSIGDHSIPCWDDAGEEQHAVVRDGVRAILNGQVDTPQQSHERWCSRKNQAGWVWGLEKDPKQKTHPCLVNWDDLPKEQREKDLIFFHLVLGFDRIWDRIVRRG